MIKNRLYLFFLILTLSGLGCKEDKAINSGVLSRNVMISIIAEIELVQAAFKVENQDEKFNLDKVSNSIFENHQTSKKQFEESLLHYSKHPQEMEKIYNDVISILSQKQVVLN